MVGKPSGQASPQHSSLSTGNPTQVLQSVLLKISTHTHTYARTRALCASFQVTLLHN